MGGIIAGGAGIAHIDSAIEVNVVLEGGVIQGYPGIVANEEGIAGIHGSVGIDIAPKETHLKAARTAAAAIGPANPSSRQGKDLLIAHARKSDNHIVTAKGDVTDVSAAHRDGIIAVGRVIGNGGAAAVDRSVEGQDDGVRPSAVAPALDPGRASEG